MGGGGRAECRIFVVFLFSKTALYIDQNKYMLNSLNSVFDFFSYEGLKHYKKLVNPLYFSGCYSLGTESKSRTSSERLVYVQFTSYISG